jgi:predicted SprT family Zn-dependent metalloprotease
MSDVNPTAEIYLWLQGVAQHFNETLFDEALPSVVFTLNRGNSSAGYFSPSRWRHRTGGLASEIAVNPTYFASQSLLSLLQTICHEQCHQWQHVHGKPGRAGYHNTEWAEKMMGIGLMPSSTGQVGGQTTGQKMTDYPISGGPFLIACAEFAQKQIELLWIDQGFKSPVAFRTMNAIEYNLEKSTIDKLVTTVGSFFPGLECCTPTNKETQKLKIKYACSSCGAKVWGKSGLGIMCSACNQEFQPQM